MADLLAVGHQPLMSNGYLHIAVGDKVVMSDGLHTGRRTLTYGIH